MSTKLPKIYCYCCILVADNWLIHNKFESESGQNFIPDSWRSFESKNLSWVKFDFGLISPQFLIILKWITINRYIFEIIPRIIYIQPHPGHAWTQTYYKKNLKKELEIISIVIV